MAGKIQDYEKLLRDLSFRASVADQSLIRKILQQVSSRTSTFYYQC